MLGVYDWLEKTSLPYEIWLPMYMLPSHLGRMWCQMFYLSLSNFYGKRLVAYINQFDKDNDGMIENGGFTSQTYNTRSIFCYVSKLLVPRINILLTVNEFFRAGKPIHSQIKEATKSIAFRSFPLGIGSDFTRTFGWQNDLHEAIEYIATELRSRIDVGVTVEQIANIISS